MPSAIAALISGEVRGKNVGFAIRRVADANECFGQI
jgi:hypothetical protein